MSRRLSHSYLIPHLFRTLLRKRATVTFPFGPLRLSDAFRGRMVVDINACIGCGVCARDCATGSLVFERLAGGGVCLVQHYDRCATCGQCAASCRSGAIRMEARFQEGALSREELVAKWIREGPSKRA